MAARWCTMVDAIHAIGRTLYRGRWAASILADKPSFPHPGERFGFVFRKAAMEQNGESRSDSTVIGGEPQIAGWSHRPRDPSWDMALGAYAVLYEALAEGLVKAEAESIAGGTVPNQYDGNEPRSIEKRGRVPIDASEWRRDDVVMAGGLVRAWWSLGSPSPRSAPWLVLIERETLNNFLERYADVLTVEAATDATEQRGRPREVSRAELEREVLPRWLAGELGQKYDGVHAFMKATWGVERTTARRYCKELGIYKGGPNAEPKGKGPKTRRGKGRKSRA